MIFPVDFLHISFPFMSPCLGTPCTATYHFKVMQRLVYTEGSNITIIRKGDPIGSKGRTSRQNVIYVNFGIDKKLFEDFIKRYFSKKYTDDITLRWEKGNQIQWVGEP